MFKKPSLIFIIILSFLTTLAYAKAADAEDPENVALVDSGYDLCVNEGGLNCSDNKNLLFRGGMPIAYGPPYIFDFENFRSHIFDYIKEFKNVYGTRSFLPNSIDELKNYRIVIINLLYDFNEHGNLSELAELENEFKFSGAVSTLQIPNQHYIYGLETEFNHEKYAFEWWPITFAKLEEDSRDFINQSLNWPDVNKTPEHSFEPKEYLPLDLPYLLTGKPFNNNKEAFAKDIHALLKTTPSDGHPLLIFYHCLAGKDRTGVVSMAYFMEFGGYPYLGKQKFPSRIKPVSFQDALIATSIPDHAPNEWAVRIGKAYERWLNLPNLS